MKVSTKALSAIGAATLIFSMSACGSILGGEAGASVEGGAAASTVGEMGPLTEILSQVWGSDLSQEEQQRRLDEENQAQQELIAQCMSEAGFEYLPNLSAGGTIIVGDDGMWRPDDRDWVMQYGYGAVRSPWETQQAEEQAALEAGGEVTTQEWFDPNQEMLESLSETERRAWDIAPLGDWENMPEGIIDDDGRVLDEDAFWNNQGCSGWARLQVRSESAFDIMNTDEFRPLMDAINEMHETMWATASVADREWATCMADAGFPGFDRQQDAQNSIWDAQNAIQNELWNNFDWESWDWDANPEGERNSPELVALGEHELELALADLDCREAVDFRARQAADSLAVETQFVNDHRAALDALLAAVAQR